MKNIINTLQASEILGVTVRQVRRYAKQGIKTGVGTLKLKTMLLQSGVYIFNKKEVFAFKEARDLYKNEQQLNRHATRF